MNKTKIMKRVLAVILSLAMVVGTWAVPGMMEANASTEPEKTGALSLVNGDGFKGTQIQFRTTNELTLNTSSTTVLTPSTGAAGVFRNGVICNNVSVRHAQYEGETDWLILAFNSFADIGCQVGTELKIFGTYTYTVGGETASILVTPTVIRCVQLDGESAKWEVVSSGEETEEETPDNLLSIDDFTEGAQGVLTNITSPQIHPLQKGDTVIGNHFQTRITYTEKAAGTSNTFLYYGATERKFQNCITMYAQSSGKVYITIWGATEGSVVNNAQVGIEGAVSEGTELLLDIDISELDAEENCTITIKLNNEQKIQTTVATPTFGTNLIVSETEAQWAATYEDCIDRTEELPENLVSFSDFGAQGVIDMPTSSVSADYALLNTADTLYGKSFKTYVTYEEIDASGTGNSMFHYGANANNGNLQDRITMYANRHGSIYVTIWSGTNGTPISGGQKEIKPLEAKKEYFLEIDISELDTVNKKCTVTIKLDNQTLFDAVEVTNPNFGTRIRFVEDAERWSVKYQDYENKKVSALMDQALEITAADFGIADGTYTVKSIGNLGQSIDGKKVVLEIAPTAETAEIARFAYANVVCHLQTNEQFQAYPSCRAVTNLKDTLSTSTYKVEMYVEYIDADNDGIKDDMRSLLRVNGILYNHIIAEGHKDTCTCKSSAEGGCSPWLLTTDQLYSDKAELRIEEWRDYNCTLPTYTVKSMNTKAKAELTEDGVLTISGTGTIVPSVVNSVVSDATKVTDIVIQNGITAVGSNVFTGYENLKTVTYADSVESVSETAFVGCSTGVKVSCPRGKDFVGGLKDAVMLKAVTNIAVPETGIVNPAVVVTKVDSADRYENLSGSAVAILNVNSDLEILDKEGNPIATVAEYMEKYSHVVIPAFYLDSADEVEEVCAYLKDKNIQDAFYMTSSSNADLLKTAREKWLYVRGILEFDTLPADLKGRGDDRREINNNLAMVAIYPSKGLSADIVAEYNVRGISVWSYAEDEGAVYAGISNGVNGLVTSNPNTILGVYTNITDVTLSGKPEAIAHRGINYHPNSDYVNSNYPENTLEGFKDSVYKGGSKGLEMDIQLTKDLELILMSPDNLDKNTNGTGYVSASTLEEIKKLYVNGTQCTVPSLREVFDEFKDTDVVLYLHVNYIKDAKGESAEGYIADYETVQRDALLALVKEFEDAGHSIADNIVIFFRGMTNTKACWYRGDYGISLIGGSFVGDQPRGNYTAEVLADQYTYIQALNNDLPVSNSQQLPYNYDLVGTDDDLAYRMAARGYLTLQSITGTKETQQSLDDWFINNLGSSAIMTNHVEYLSDYNYQIDAKDEIWVVGETINLQQKVKTREGDELSACKLEILSGGENLIQVGDSYTMNTAGSAQVVYYKDVQLSRDDGSRTLSYRIYSAPVTITMVDESYLGNPDLDDNYTVVDLVKMMKAISHSASSLSIGIYDVNRDEVVDDGDLSYMREVLVGKSQIHYGAQIELAAFMGPPSASYRKWNDTWDGSHPDDVAAGLGETGWDTFITEENLQDYKDAGFTYLLSESSFSYRYDIDFEGSDTQTYMNLAEKMGLPVVLYPSSLASRAVNEEKGAELSDYDKQMIDQMLADLSPYKMFKGISLRDEPSGIHAGTYKTILDYVWSKNPDLYHFTCMLPIYGKASAFTSDESLGEDQQAAYKDYIGAFADATGTFAYDHYPLLQDSNQVTSLREDYYLNYELVANEAKGKFDTGMVVQSSSWGTVDSIPRFRATNTKADIAFQVYSALAYGAKYITYYTYWEHIGQGTNSYVYDAMVMYPDTVGGKPIKTETYYAVQAMNQELKKFDHVFLKYDWDGSMAVTAADKEKSTMLSHVGDYDSERIESVTATDETLIGCMKDKDGNDGFFVVNATDPGKNLSNSVTVTFNNATSAICYINGEETTVDLTNGSYTFNLTAGQGIFVIPVQ